MNFSFPKKLAKKGFTLVELMIVIAILGILFVTVSQFDLSARTNQERANNFANLIADTIRDTRQDAMIGKMTTDNSGRAEVEKREFKITKNEFYSGYFKKWASGVMTEKIFSGNPGFIDGDKNYKIEAIEVSNRGFSNDYFDSQNNSVIMLDVSDLTITFKQDWSEAKSLQRVNWSAYGNTFIRTFRIKVDYKWFKRYIYGDVISGAVQVLNQWN